MNFTKKQIDEARRIIEEMVAEFGTQMAVAEQLELSSSGGISLLLKQDKLTPSVYRATIHKPRYRRCGEFTNRERARKWDKMLVDLDFDSTSAFMDYHLTQWEDTWKD